MISIAILKLVKFGLACFSFFSASLEEIPSGLTAIRTAFSIKQ
jgi:hypothetical protein